MALALAALLALLSGATASSEYLVGTGERCRGQEGTPLRLAMQLTQALSAPARAQALPTLLDRWRT